MFQQDDKYLKENIRTPGNLPVNFFWNCKTQQESLETTCADMLAILVLPAKSSHGGLHHTKVLISECP